MSKFLVGVGLVLALAASPQAQTTKSGTQDRTAAKQDGSRPLDLQKIAFEKYEDLKSSMRRLHQELQKTDKDKAKRLQAGLVLLHEKRIAEAMKEIEGLLAEESWDLGLEKMKEVQRNFGLLLNLLMDRDVDLQEILEEIARLENFKDKVEKLIEEQKAEKAASAEAEALEKHLKDIERAKADVAKLLEEQSKLEVSTEAKGAGKKDSQDLAGRQGELREDAENLEEDLQEIENQARELGAGGEGQGKGKGEGQGAGGAAKSAANAGQSMGKSQQKLGSDQPESSLDDQQQALDELENAKEALEDLEEAARRKLLELPFERFEREQLDTMGKTKNLADEMDEADSGEGEDGEGQPTPGQQNVEQAVPKQKNAAGSLKKIKPGKAKKNQQDAQDELEEARQKLEDALAQLRQELREEVLRALEERFTEMLAKQRQLTVATVRTEKWRIRFEALVKDGLIPTQVKNRCHKLAEGEGDLRQSAQDALSLIDAEGSSAVFPEIVKSLIDDFDLVTGMLDGFATDDDTHRVQKEIETTLEQLIDALTRRIEQLEGTGGT